MAEIDLRDQNNVRDMLPHKPMRLSMENKNLLSKKGDIYVGTGGTQTVIIEDDTYIIAETAKVSVPSEVISSNESAILIYDTANNLQYKKSSKSGFVTYGVEQSLTDGQKSTARNNIGAAAVSDLTFVSYTVDQTKIIVDPSGQESGPKTTLLKNIFNGLTGSQKNYVRSQIDAGSAQGIAGITAGNGIKVDSNTPSSPKVSVNLAQNSGMEFYSNQLKLKIGDGISVSNGAISVNLAQNSGLVFDSFSPGKLKLNVNSSSQSGNKYWVQIDSDNHPYVNVAVPSYTGGNGISVADGAISVNLADNSGLVCDSSSPKRLKLNVNSKSQDGDKYWVQIDSNNNHPYVNVSVPSGNNQTIVYAPTTTASSGITSFGNNATVKLVPGDNITMMASASSTNNYIQISATDTTYSAAVGGGIKLEGTSFSLNTGTMTTNKDYAVALSSGGIPYVHVPWVEYTGSNGISVSNGAISLKGGYDVPIEYQSSASSTTGFISNKLYLIGTWTGV